VVLKEAQASLDDPNPSNAALTRLLKFVARSRKLPSFKNPEDLLP
jgi:hypothetical protein